MKNNMIFETDIFETIIKEEEGFTLELFYDNSISTELKFKIRNYLIFPNYHKNKIFFDNRSCLYQSTNKNDFTNEIKKEMKEFLFQKKTEELKEEKSKYQKKKAYFNEYFKDEIRVKKIKNVIDEK